MQIPDNETLLKQYILLEKDKQLCPEGILIIEYKQKKIREILEWKGIII